MVDDSKYKQYLFVTSLIITVVVFCSGTALGWTLDNFKVNSLLNSVKQNDLNAESFALESSFIQGFGGDYCTILDERVENLQQDIITTGKELSTWGGNRKTLKESDFAYLKRKYFLLEARFLLLLQNMEKSCGNKYDVAVFFYKIDDARSLVQGYALDELRKNHDNLIVLSFDKDYIDEPLISVLLSMYNVTEAPSVVINGKTLIGYSYPEQIEKYLGNKVNNTGS